MLLRKESIVKIMPLFQLTLLLAVALVISTVEVQLFRKLGLSPGVQHSIAMADQVRLSGSMPRTAFYPPLGMLIALGLKSIGIVKISPYVFNFSMLAMGLAAMYGMSKYVSRSRLDAFIAVAIALFNPYFIWTLLLSRDSSVEFMFLTVLLWLAVVAVRMPEDSSRSKKCMLGTGLVGSAILLLLSRVTGLFIVLALILMGIWQSGTVLRRKFFALCGAAFVVLALLFCTYNYFLVGEFTLATNGGINLYIGNHPAYLHGHPHYDIDVFVGKMKDEEIESLGEVERNRAYFRKGINFILADPVSFIYRSITKSVWHWVNLEKIPNYTSHTWAEKASGKPLIAHLGSVNVTPGLAYLLYKLLYLPVFIVSIAAVLRKRIDSRYGLLYAPLLGLWLVVVLTFPDTRFKINAEVLVLPAMIATCRTWRKPRQES